VVGRPRIWKQFRRLTWAADYEYADDGRVRDQSRNVLTEHGPDFLVTLRVNGGAKSFPKREILALEWYDYPPWSSCVICGRGPHFEVVHLDGNPRNCARDNIKWAPNEMEARRHEYQCCDRIMRERPHGIRTAREGRRVA
jgi:hypothetical protein